MRHRKSGRKLGRHASHRRAMFKNLAISLIEHERLATTDAKAKELRPIVEKLVTLAKKGDLHARRVALSKLGNKDAVAKLFEAVGPRFADRDGGYVRLVKLGNRPGDNAPITLIEFVGSELAKADSSDAEEEAAAE
ncbi:MAG: 50S ribosomal protein L17 [Myxococcales bacterium]|nr:50S ribosomal protein L17 [Myxococcales bacterium]